MSPLTKRGLRRQLARLNVAALELWLGLVLEDGRKLGDVATDWQLRLLLWALDPESEPNRIELRPRGGSKTTDIGALAIVLLLEVFPPGSRAYCFAVDRDQSRLLVDAIAGFAARTPALTGAITVNNFTVTTRSGSVLEVMASDSASAWGLKPILAIADEWCQWASTSNARTLWEAITSSMGKVPGARLLCASTAGDPGSWQFRVYEAALKSPNWSVQSVKGPLGWTSKEFLAEQRAMLPDSVYERLHANVWCAPEGRLTSVDDVRACITHSGPLEPVEGARYVMGVDLGVTNDRTVCCVCHGEHLEASPEVRRIVVDRLEAWTPSKGRPVDLRAAENWIRTAARQYRAKCVVDPYQAVAMCQRLRASGIRIEEFTFSQASVGRLAMALHTTLKARRLSLPDDPELIDELVNVRLRETSPNVYRLDHDPDRHDDRAIALALAVLDITSQPVERLEVLFDPTPTPLDGRPVQLLNGAYAMSPNDTLAAHLDRLGGM